MFNDKRSGKIALVAHYILNQNSRALGLAENSSTIAEVVELLMKSEIGIVQMPCPELAFAGVLRQPKTKDQYDEATFRRHCRKIAEELANQVQEYDRGRVKLKLVIGVDESPSCGVNGILVEELHSALGARGISVPFYAIRHERLNNDLAKLRSYAK